MSQNVALRNAIVAKEDFYELSETLFYVRAKSEWSEKGFFSFLLKLRSC